MRRARLAPPARRPAADFGLAQVNIVLLLVLFFLVTGTIVETEEQAVLLPETRDLPLDRLPRPLLLIDDAGDWSLDGVDVAAGSVVDALALAPAGPIHLLVSRTAPAEVALEALDALAPTERRVLLVTLSQGVGGAP